MSGSLVIEAGKLESGRQPAIDGVTGCSVTAFQLSNVGNAQKWKPSKSCIGEYEKKSFLQKI